MITVTRPIVPDPNVFSALAKKIFDNAWFTNAGPLVLELEEKLRKITGSAHFHLVSNGTIAIELALQAAGIRGEVITTPFTFCATTNSIERVGATPVFVDVLPEDLTIDPDAIEAMIGPETEAILGVHVYGRHCNMPAIQRIADKHGLFVLYDAAHAFDTLSEGRPISEYGDATTYSFHATKLFHTGEGGAIETRNADLSRKIQLKRNFGIAAEGVHQECGTNAKLPEMSAAIGLALLESYVEERAKRKVLARHYQLHLADLEEISLDLRFSESGYYFVIRVAGEADLRDALQAHLASKGILARRYFWPLTSILPLEKKVIAPGGTPIAASASNSVLALPFFGDLGLDQIECICRHVREFFGKRL